MIKLDDMYGWIPKNEEEVDEMFEYFEAFKERISQVTSRYCKADKGYDYSPDMDEADIRYGPSGMITIEWTEFSCGGYETRNIEYPIKFLWTENWEKEMEQERIRKNIEAVKAKQAEKARQKAYREKQEYLKYLKLKEKFEEEK